MARNKPQVELEKELGIISQNQKKQDLDSELINHGHLDSFLEDWISQEENGQYKNFNTVIEEVKQRKDNNTDLHKILERISDRRTNRNNFFHNHEQSSLTVHEEASKIREIQ